MSKPIPSFKPQADGSLTCVIHGFRCTVSPIDDPRSPGADTDTWSVDVHGICVVKATDELEHALRRCVAFCQELVS